MTTTKKFFKDYPALNPIGQGTWFMGDDASKQQQEIRALKLGIELGLTLIDTAEMYADGNAEIVVAKAIQGLRDKVFLVSKVYPQNASKSLMHKACENSLKRLNTEYLDLYLLHWRGSIPLIETVTALEDLVKAGKIKAWGVSNFDLADMQELFSLAEGSKCSTNQVLYHLASRGIEYDLAPWCQSKNLPIMAYCPLAQAGRLRNGLLNNPILQQLAEKYHATVAQILLAWVIRNANTIAIPKAASMQHVIDNSKVIDIILSAEDLKLLDLEFIPPNKKIPLDIV